MATPNHSGSLRQLWLIGSDSDEHNRLLKLFRSYANGGFDVRFVGMDRMGRRPREHVTAEGLRCTYLTSGWGYSNWKLLIGYPIWMLKVFFFLLRVRPRFIHVFEFDSAVPVAIYSLFRRVAYAYDVQDNFELRRKWSWPVMWLIRKLDGLVLSRAQALVVPDEKRLVGTFAGYRSIARIIPNCPPDVARPANLPKTRPFTVLCTGELSRRRGIHLILQAADAMPGIKILMAGRFTDPEVEQAALGHPAVDFRGWVRWDEAIALGYGADIVYSFYDPAYAINLLANAQKWFDAMMTGTPVLCNSEVLNSRWLLEQNLGYACPFGDVSQLVSVLQFVRDHPEDAKSRGASARRLYEEQFNWKKMETILLQTWNGLMNGSSTSLREAVTR